MCITFVQLILLYSTLYRFNSLLSYYTKYTIMEFTSIDQKIANNIKYRRNNKEGARRLHLPIEDYIKRKAEIKKLLAADKNIITNNYITELEDKIVESNYNLDKGTGTLKGYFSTEPMSGEDVEIKFKVDKSKWRVSMYWNKQQPNGMYLVSAQITQNKHDPINITEELTKIIQSYNYSYTPTTLPNFNINYGEPMCAVLSFQDIHIGKLSVDNLDTVIEDTKNCLQNLVYKGYQSYLIDKIIWVIGGDLLNMDTYGGTTTSGTIIENNMAPHEAYKAGFDLQFWCINFLKQYCKTLEVVYIPGNHDRQSSAHIAYAMSKLIVSDNIIWNIDEKERKAIQYGTNMIGLEHGDFSTSKSFFAFATEYPKMWGDTTNRIVYTGHYHKKKTIEYITQDEISGFQLKILPSLSRTDHYHYSNKWTNNQRGAVIEFHSATKGYMGQFNCTL